MGGNSARTSLRESIKNALAAIVGRRGMILVCLRCFQSAVTLVSAPKASPYAILTAIGILITHAELQYHAD
jgi:hypothetical protein